MPLQRTKALEQSVKKIMNEMKMDQSGHLSPPETMSSSQHPSSSSYTTAEEDPFNTTNNCLTVGQSSGTLQQLQSRIKHLEEKLAEKEETLCALKLELDAARDTSGVDASIGPLSFGPDEEYKIHLAGYLAKLQENSTAIAQRDEMIRRLEFALKQRVSDQEKLNGQVASLTDLVQCLQSQLHSVSQHLQEPQKKLLLSLKEKELELQGKTAELAHCKTQSANEVQSLMHSLEKLQQQGLKALGNSNSGDKPSQQKEREIDKLKQHYDSEIKRLHKDVEQACQAESVLNSKLAASQHECDKLTSDLHSLHLSHDAVVSSLKEEMQKNLYHYNKQQETLQEEVRGLQQNLKASLSQSSLLQSEVKSLNSQVKEKTELCFQQEERMCLLQAEHSSEMTTCYLTIDEYKVQLDSLKNKFCNALAEKHASYHAEVTLLQEQMEQLKQTHSKELITLRTKIEEKEGRLSEELQSMQLSYENEINTSRRELEHLRKELKEKASLIVSKEQHIGTLEQKLKNENQCCQAFKEVIQTLNQKLHINKGDISSLKHKVVALEKQIQQANEACLHHLQKISSLEQQLEGQLSQMKNIEEQLKMAQKQLTLEQQCGISYKEQFETCRREFINCQQEKDDLQQRFEDINKHHQNILSKLEEKTSIISTLEAETDSVKKQLRQEQELSTSLKENINLLNSKIREITVEKSSQEKVLLDEKNLSLALQEKVEELTEILQRQSETESKTKDMLSPSLEKGDENLSSDISAVHAKLTEERELKDLYIRKCEEFETLLAENQRQIDSYKNLLDNNCKFPGNQRHIEFPNTQMLKREQHLVNLTSGEEVAPGSSENVDAVEQFHGDLKYNSNSSCENLSILSGAKNKTTEELKKSQDLCTSYKLKIGFLESELRNLSEVNLSLKEQQKSIENELNRVQTESAKCKKDFQEECSALRKELTLKEEEIENLVKHSGDIQSHKDEINSYNIQVKDLLAVKSALEEKLTASSAAHQKEISCYEERVCALEKKLQKHSEHDTLSVLVNKCQHDLQLLKEMYLAWDDNILKSADGDNQNTFERLNDNILDEHNVNHSVKLRKGFNELSGTNDDLCMKLQASRQFGLQYLEKLLQICDETLSKQLGSEETLAVHLSRSNILVEKLQIQLVEAMTQSSSLSKECEALKTSCRVLENRLAHPHYEASAKEEISENLLLSNANCISSPPIPEMPVHISYWVHHCKELEEKNKSLSKEIHILQLKSEEYEIKLSSCTVNPETGSLAKNYDKRRLFNIKEFEEKWETSLSKIENLCSEFSNKEALCLEKVEEVIRGKCEVDSVKNENVQCKLKPALKIASKSCEVLLLQDQVQRLKLQQQMYKLMKDNQSQELRRLVSLLEESWHENSSLKIDLQNALHEVKVLSTKMKRVEAFYTCQRERSSVIEPGLLQIIGNLESSFLSSHALSAEQSPPLKPPLSLIDQIESSIKISSKMIREREGTLASLQDDDKNVATYQTEALNLRRLHTSLQSLLETLVYRSGPVMQVHVDLLNHQLAEKESMYQDACESMFALEAELRELEEKKHQQEEKFQEELCKLRFSEKYWQLKSEMAQASAVLEQCTQTDINQDMIQIIGQLNTLYSECLSEMCIEFEKAVSIREEQVRMEMAERILSLESTCKQHLADLTQHVQLDPSWKHLEVLHKQELAAANAAHEYRLLKEVLDVRKQYTACVNSSLKANPISTHNVSLQLIKHNVTAQYKAAVRKIALNWYNQWEKQSSSFDAQLELVCANQVETNNANMLHNADLNLNRMEDLLSESKQSCEKLHTALSTVLQSLVSTVDEEFHLITKKLQEINEDVQNAVNVAVLQEELKKSEEKHRLAIESITVRHNVEETRLRLMLTSAEMAKAGDSKESSLIALRRELEEKHKREMEDLRTYFEQKCADFEKHYSEEVFSQHSRKMSDCSSASESEIVSEMYYAGPGSAASIGPSSQPHLCDSLGESSFKEFESQAVDLEKLLQESREQLETMRIALESRHNAELEAQREVYEARVEELLRAMEDSHNGELQLQSRKLQELQDIESLLKSQLSTAEDEIKLLKSKLDDTAFANTPRPPECELEVELNTQVQLLTDALKKKESESSAQVATLKAKLRDNCDALSKMEREIANLKAKHDEDLISIKKVLSDKDLEIEELKCEIHRESASEEWKEQVKTKLKEEIVESYKLQLADLLKEKDAEMNCKLEDQHSQLLNLQELLISKKDEQNKLALAELEEKYDNQVKEKKALLDVEYSEYLEFVKMCADETKVKLVESHAKELEDLSRRYERQLAEMKSGHKVDPAQASNKHENSEAQINAINEGVTLEQLLQKTSWIDDGIPRGCLSDLLEMSRKLQRAHKSELEALATEHHRDLCLKEKEQDVRMDTMREECERRFHLQLEEARTDIVQALEHHIQQLLDDDNNESDKPPQLQQLEEKLTSKYRHKLKEMQTEHNKQIAEMQRTHAANLEKIRRSTIISSEELSNLHKERDCLRNVAASLRDVVAELVRYFMSCEDELNSTLMNELAKLESYHDNELLSITILEESSAAEGAYASVPLDTSGGEDMSVIVATPARGRRSLHPKRVRFAPDVSSLLSFIDDDSILEGVGLGTSMRDASLNFHEELDRCLERLRCESAALLEMSRPPSGLPALPEALEQSEPDQLRAQLEEARRCKEQLSSRLSSCRRNLKQLQQEHEELQAELDVVREERERLLAELQRLAHLQLGPPSESDLVAEGYGEGEGQGDESSSSGSPRATTTEELQDKARTLLLGGAASPNSTQQQLVEELCRDWERLAEEARRRQDDLQQQVEAADKQLRSTRAFLDEQAAEREQERDDFVREIQRLQEQLRDKDRERSTHQQMNQEVEALENQLKESQTALQEALSKLEKLDIDQKQAVDKIWTLRDIISDLELQVATKAEEAATVQTQNDSLQHLLEQQGRTQFELAQEMEALQHSSGNGALSDRIGQLEEELRKHRLQAEQFGDLSTVQQIKSQLRDLEISLESRTKEMEFAHASTAAPASPCLSSPSEDVSIRETLEALRAATGNTPALRVHSPITLPVDEVTRLQEQWQRHLRMDDAVLKKVRDLDMRLDDIQAEKHVLAKRLQEQMHLISSLEAKLDEHRCKAEAKQLEFTSPLRQQIEDLEAEVQTYVETLESRERQIKSLENALHHAKLNLSSQEAEVRKNVQTEHNSTIQLQLQISKLNADKERTQALLNERQVANSSLPVLVESMLADKNADIDRLEKRVQELTKQVEQGSQYIATPSSTLEFEYCEQEKFRAHVELSPVLELKRSFNVTSTVLEKTQLKDTLPPVEVGLPVTEPACVSFETGFLEPVELASPKPIPAEDSFANMHDNKNIHSSNDSASSFAVSNAFTLPGLEKHVESLNHALNEKDRQLHDCQSELSEKSKLVVKLDEKCKRLEDCEIKLAEMSSLEKELKTVREDLQHTVTGINADKEFFESQLKAKDTEVQHLKGELHATQDLIVNLQRKVQEAKQIAVSPNRSSPDSKLALQKIQSDLQTAYQENRFLKDKLSMIKMDIEKNFLEKENELKSLYESECEKVHSLQENVLKYQQEILSSKEKTSREKELEQELMSAKTELQHQKDQLEQLQNEVKQLNTECVTLKHQLNIPVAEAVALAEKLEAEKKFSKALQEELSMFKSKAHNLELECQDLQNHTRELEFSSKKENRVASIIEENQSFQSEISQLKCFLQEARADHNCVAENLKKSEQEIARLREKNTDLEKALLDKKIVLKKCYDLENSRSELKKLFQEKTAELQNIVCNNKILSKELSLLRSAIKNIHSQHEFPGLADEDSNAIHEIRKEIVSLALKGGGDGPWQRLSASEIDVYEIRPDSSQLSDSGSLDDLTGMVRQELDLSARLDDTLFQSLDPLTNQKPTSKLARKSQEAVPPGDHLKAVTQLNHGVEQRSFPYSQTRNPDVEQLQSHVLNLEVQLNKERTSVQLLQNHVDRFRLQYGALQKQDSDLIEDLRIKLAKALDTEKELRQQLSLQINRGCPSLDTVCQPLMFSDKCVETSATIYPDSSNLLQEQLNATTYQLEMARMEKDAIEKKFRRLHEAEVRRSRRRAVYEEQHKGQINQLQAAQSEKQQEYSVLRQQLSKVTDELKLTREELAKERESQLVGNTPVMERLKEMNIFLEELIEENRRMTKQLEQFTEEHKKLSTRNAQLEQQLLDRQKPAATSSNIHDRFPTSHSAFAGAKHSEVSDSEIEDRVNNLFGRYLRTESYRKALVWQKRYLLSVINGINELKNLTESHFSSLKSRQRPQEKRLQPHQKFRSAVFTIIAIHRMHFLVGKWHRGKRIGCSAVLNEAYIGVPSRGQHFTPPSYAASSSAERFRGGLSQSPPTLERPRQSRSHSSTSQFSRYSSSNTLGITDNLSEYTKLFDAANRACDILLLQPPK